MANFIMQLRDKPLWDLLKYDHNGFILLTAIAQRARRTDTVNIFGLEIGEALLGDHREIGMSRGEYREATKRLTKLGFTTIRTTSKGTVFKLIDSSVYDINEETTTNNSTIEQPSSNHPTTTNNNDKKEKNDKKEDIYSVEFDQFWVVYPRKVGKKEAFRKWKKCRPPIDLVMAALEWQIPSKHWEDGYVLNPATYINQGRWEDEPVQGELSEADKFRKKHGLEI